MWTHWTWIISIQTTSWQIPSGARSPWWPCSHWTSSTCHLWRSRSLLGRMSTIYNCHFYCCATVCPGDDPVDGVGHPSPAADVARVAVIQQPVGVIVPGYGHHCLEDSIPMSRAPPPVLVPWEEIRLPVLPPDEDSIQRRYVGWDAKVGEGSGLRSWWQL